MDRTDESRLHYQAYLIRFWRDDAHHPWRATAVRSGTDHIYHFAAVEALVAFLEQRLADEPAPGEEDAASGPAGGGH